MSKHLMSKTKSDNLVVNDNMIHSYKEKLEKLDVTDTGLLYSDSNSGNTSSLEHLFMGGEKPLHTDSQFENPDEGLEKITLDRFKEIDKLSNEHNIVQLTSFGATGIVICDFLHKTRLINKIPTIFIDTLFHFQNTYQLVEQIKEMYPEMRLEITKPLDCNNENDFNKKYGNKLWEVKPSKYGYYTKIEPRDRMMKKYQSIYYINGRRRSQGFERSNLDFIQYSDEYVRIQPLYDWTEENVWDYIKKYNLHYNTLHDEGYRSIGDYHSTFQTLGENERDGRKWGEENQTECGLHIKVIS